MGRPRSFDTQEVVEAATHVFWEKGYAGTAIEDLERRTTLNRSSLYWAFGSKEGLFLRTLDAYLNGFIAPRLAPMEQEGADTRAIEGFFVGLAQHFRADDVSARRGCLVVNSIAEFEGRGNKLGNQARAFRDRLDRAFSNALASGLDPERAAERARLLTSATLGVWLAARIAPADAAGMCDAWIRHVQGWHAESDE